MKKTLAAAILTIALVGAGGAAAHADTTDPDTPVSTDTTDGAIVSETGAPETVGDTPSTPSGPIESPSSLCEGGVVSYRATQASSAFTPATGANSSVSGQGGITLSISRSSTFGVTGTVSSTTGVSVNAALVAVKEDIGVSVALNKSGTSSSSGSWTVPSSWKLGRLQIGAIKHRGSVQKYIENRACKKNPSGGAAIYNVPEAGWSFRHTHVS